MMVGRGGSELKEEKGSGGRRGLCQENEPRQQQQAAQEAAMQETPDRVERTQDISAFGLSGEMLVPAERNLVKREWFGSYDALSKPVGSLR